ncbi:MAG: hypothetical protein AB1656_13760 [Candidatus Omnitrophota bacterium]
MKIVATIRQLPDLIEPLIIDASGSSLDYGEARFLVNEYDDHALEQAVLLKEQHGASVTVVALDFGDVNDALYTAAAKGVDRIVKIPYEQEKPPSPRTAAELFAGVIRDLQPDLILAGVQSYEEWDGSFTPLLAHTLQLPYVGLIQGVECSSEQSIMAFKEFPGAAKARMNIRLPAVLGILAASHPPRYVPISRVRTAMKTAHFEEIEAALLSFAPKIQLEKLYTPITGARAEMIDGSESEIANRIVQLLTEKGVLK